MLEPEKPFVCKHENCKMSFTNIDHLTIHTKKHDMNLYFNLEQKGLFNDQTPTPTRFIRNCEEVGLFQDLQNLNPFDDTFRKATEFVTNGGNINSLSNDKNNDDSLHTPQVFLNLSQTCKFDLEKKSEATKQKINENKTNAPPEELKDGTNKATVGKKGKNNVKETKKRIIEKLKKEKKKKSPALIIPSTHVLMNNSSVINVPNIIPQAIIAPVIYTINPIVNPASKVQTIPILANTINPIIGNQIVVQDQKNLTSQLLKKKIESSKEKQINQNLNLPISTNTIQIVGNNTIAENMRNENELSNDKIEANKKDFLERNRAASKRSRLKRKQMFNHLIQKNEMLSKANKDLIKENLKLKNEIANLKKLLITQKINEKSTTSGILQTNINRESCIKQSPKKLRPNIKLLNIKKLHLDNISDSVTLTSSSEVTDNLKYTFS